MQGKFNFLLFLLIIFNSNVKAQLIEFEDENFKDAIVSSFNIDLNNDGEISLEEAELVRELNVNGNQINSIDGIEHFINLEKFYCGANNLQEIDVSQNLKLNNFGCGGNNLTELDVSLNVELEILSCSENSLQSINLEENTKLIFLGIGENELVELILNENRKLKHLTCSENNITNLNIELCDSLITLGCDRNLLTELNLDNNDLLEVVNCQGNLLQAIDLSGKLDLVELDCSSNQLSSLDLSSNEMLENVNSSFNNLEEIFLHPTGQLEVLIVRNNMLSEIILPNTSSLNRIEASQNMLSSLDLTNLSGLRTLRIGENNISELDLSSNDLLRTLACNDNNLSELELLNTKNLNELYCGQNNITSLDFSQINLLTYSFFTENPLVHLNLKNGRDITEFDSNGNGRISFEGLTTLRSICADETEIGTLINLLSNENLTNVIVSEYCSFDLGGDLYTILGNVLYDFNEDGCDDQDSMRFDIRFEISNGDEIGFSTVDTDGKYSVGLSEGMYGISTKFRNSELYIIDPEQVSVSFPDDGDSLNQNFCISPPEIDFKDLKVEMFPLNVAQAGFDFTIKVVYQNFGPRPINGRVVLHYDSQVQTLFNSTLDIDNESDNRLEWSYENLEPFEMREFEVSLLLNSPLDDLPLFGGEFLQYNLIVYDSDENIQCTLLSLSEEVVNSFDPNDKQCLEGQMLSEEYIGDFVNYLIRFENIGTAAARNVVVKDLINTSMFDISSFELGTCSHEVKYRKSNINELEFYFEDIQLSHLEGENMGYINYRIKSLPSLALGDSLTNQAEIYFDFNPPIITNEEKSTFGNFGIDIDLDGFTNDIDCDDFNPNINPSIEEIPNNGIDENCDGLDIMSSTATFGYFSVNVFPNPVNNVIYIETEESLSFELSLINSNGKVINTFYNKNRIDVSTLPFGIYFLKIADLDTDQAIVKRITILR